jgi:hypothetical protein
LEYSGDCAYKHFQKKVVEQAYFSGRALNIGLGLYSDPKDQPQKNVFFTRLLWKNQA